MPRRQAGQGGQILWALDERIDYVINKARKKGAGEDVINNILKKKQEAGEFIRGIERKTGRSIDDIALGKDN